MKKILIIPAAILSLCADAHSQLIFSGNNLPAVTELPAASTGLEAVYVLPQTDGVRASYRSTVNGTVKWYRFSNLGGGYAEEVTDVIHDGDMSTLSRLTGDMGYIIDDGSTRHCYWVVDYSSHRLNLRGIDISPESDCATLVLDFNGEASPLRYYTVNGQMQELDRELKLSYSTLKFDGDAGIYIFDDTGETLSHVNDKIYVKSPLCNTDFTLSGDRFLEAWGEHQSITSRYYEATAVECHTTAEQVERDNDNEQKDDVSGLGGSAPAEIDFHGVATDAAVFKEWQIATDPEFEIIDYRSNDYDLNYVFRSEGNFYVRLMVSNAAGSCDYYSPTYEVSIGDSDIKCPNAFSPGSSEGVNDVWKISYKSLVEFECHIFNRWGIQVAHFTEPSQGWDGKHNGKLVPSGVYYYVIKAKGADGKDYNLRGDINIIGYRQGYSGSGSVIE